MITKRDSYAGYHIKTGMFILVFYFSGIVYKQVENDCCVGVYHGRQTLVKIRMIIERQDPKEEVPTPKLRSLMHFLENGRCVN